MVAVFGGSLGARRINQAVDGLAERWNGPGRPWRSTTSSAGGTGTSHDPPPGADRIVVERPGRAGSDLVRVPYEERMAAVYAAADLVVCRAGAMTVAELAVAGVPAVLVPLPGSAR